MHALHNSWRQCLVGPKIAQCSLLVAFHCWLKLHIAQFQSSAGQARLCLVQFKKLVSLLTTRTMPCIVFVVTLLTSRRKLRNLWDQSHRYIASQFSSSFRFSTNILLSISASMSPGIKVFICLSVAQVQRFPSKRVEGTVQSTLRDVVDQVSMNVPTDEDIELFIDKEINIWWQKHHSKQHHQQHLKAAYQMHERKRKFANNIEAKQSCKIKRIHLWWK